MSEDDHEREFDRLARPLKPTDRLWITWEHQRRSTVLAEHFGCQLVELCFEGRTRYIRSIGRTLALLLKLRPTVLFVQNPSMLLATVAVLWGMVSPTRVVVDRHSTFLLGRENDRRLSLQVHRALSRFTIRFADLTIVTNAFLADLVRLGGGRASILPDKLPQFDPPASRIEKDRRRKVVFVSSFAPDEPLSAVLDAAAQADAFGVDVYVTGKLSKLPKAVIDAAPANVIFTDYLSDDAYVDLLRESDLILVLTTSDHTMLCGCYEAVAMERPLVTSDFQVLRSYFDGAVFVDNSSAAIFHAIVTPEADLATLRDRIRETRLRIRASWNDEAHLLQQAIAL